MTVDNVTSLSDRLAAEWCTDRDPAVADRAVQWLASETGLAVLRTVCGIEPDCDLQFQALVNLKFIAAVDVVIPDYGLVGDPVRFARFHVQVARLRATLSSQQ